MEISPSVYEHAAAFLGRTPWEVSRDARLLFEAHRAAYAYYRQQPVMPGIDIYNLEPEAYGATVVPPSESGIPAIGRPPYASTADLLRLPPLNPLTDGRIPMLIDVGRRLAQRFPEADIRVPLSGPFSIASNLIGAEALLIDVALEPQRTTDALMHLVDGQVAFAEEVRGAGLDVAFFESSACPPLLSAESFRRVELPALKEAMRRISQVAGHPIPCIIGGDTEPIVDAMLETGTGYLICPSETDQPKFMRKVWDRIDVRIRINMDPGVLSRGTWEQIQQEADRVIGLVAGRPNVCIGTGALPYEAPPEHVKRLMEYVKTV